MAYAARPDGLFDVTLDDGTTLPMSLSEQQLQEAGHQPVGGGMPQGAVAANEYYQPQNTNMSPAQPPEAFSNPYLPAWSQPYASAEDAGRRVRGDIEPIGDTPAIPLPSPNGRGAFRAGIPSEKQKINPVEYLKTHTITGQRVEAKPTFNTAGAGPSKPATAEPAPGATVQRAAPENLVSMPGAGGGAAAAGPAPRGGGGGSGGGGAKPYRLPEDIRSDLTGDTRPEDTILSAQHIADLREQEQADREKLLLDQRAQLDAQRAQRADVDRRIREKEELIGQREREAEALRPQSAKEIWQDRGSFAQAMGAVTMMLGGWLQGFQNRATNPGVDLLNDAIRQEISDQRARYEDAKEKGRDARNDYSRAIEIYGTPEAAEQDMAIRRYAIAENMIKNRGMAVGTAEYLQAANSAAEALKQQRGQAKMQLMEFERAKTVQAASAAAAAAQAQNLAKNGIVKIGSQYYTIDPSTKQFVPLDKAAALAQKGAAEGEGGIPGRGLALEVRANTAQTALNKFAKSVGVERSPEGGYVVTDPKKYAESFVMGTKAYNHGLAARKQLAGEHAVITNGGNQPSVEEKKEYHDMWVGTMRPGQVEAYMDNLQENIDTTKETLRTTRIRRAGETGGENE